MGVFYRHHQVVQASWKVFKCSHSALSNALGCQVFLVQISAASAPGKRSDSADSCVVSVTLFDDPGVVLPAGRQNRFAHVVWPVDGRRDPKGVFGIGSARWPDGPPQSGVAQGFNLIQVSGVGEAVSDEKIGGNGVERAFNKDMTNDEINDIFEAHKTNRQALEPNV